MACWNSKLEKGENCVVIRSGNRENSYYGKFWVAKITGRGGKFGLEREFVNGGRTEIVLTEDGIYQIHRSCQWGNEGEQFIEIKNGDFTEMSRSAVEQHFINQGAETK